MFFGYCRVERRYRAFHFSARPSASGLVFDRSEKEVTPDPIAFGSGAEVFSERFARVKAEGDAFGRTVRLPRAVVDQIVRDGAVSSVGGDVQLAFANRSGLELFQNVAPITLGRPEARITFLGRDYGLVAQVGEFRIGLSGMA